MNIIDLDQALTNQQENKFGIQCEDSDPKLELMNIVDSALLSGITSIKESALGKQQVEQATSCEVVKTVKSLHKEKDAMKESSNKKIHSSVVSINSENLKILADQFFDGAEGQHSEDRIKFEQIISQSGLTNSEGDLLSKDRENNNL